jgi:hypothetical protein
MNQNDTSDADSDTTDRTSAALSGRDARGRFGVGNPGKRPGCRHRATRAMADLLQAEGEAVTRAAIAAAIAGDVSAQRLVLERLVPARRPEGACIELPELAEAATPSARCDAVIRAVARGDLPAEVGRQLLDGIAAAMRVVEIDEIERRIAALETGAKP